jgi:CBS domain-containing protein/ribosome-associated translation inhibitor RaiA
MPAKFDVVKITAKDIMSRDVITAAKDETVSEALGKMKKHDIHELPIVEGSSLVGLVDYGSITRRRKLVASTKLGDIMSIPPTILVDSTLLDVADTLLSSNLRAVPVLSKKSLVGVVSRADIVKVFPKFQELTAIPIETIMTHSPLCVSEDDDVEKARHLMINLDERSVPVVDDLGKLTGIISEKDIVNAIELTRAKEIKGEFRGERKPIELKVKGVMTDAPYRIERGKTLGEAITLMNRFEVSSVVVTEKEKPVGIITQSDILELLVSLREQEGVYVQITGMHETDADIYNSMYDIIGKSMRKINHLIKPRTVSVHVLRSHDVGGAYLYDLRLKVRGEKGTYHSRSSDWDVFKTLDDSLIHIEKQVRKDHEKKIDSVRHVKDIKGIERRIEDDFT